MACPLNKLILNLTTSKTDQYHIIMTSAQQCNLIHNNEKLDAIAVDKYEQYIRHESL